jgi:serine/threonine-protein kinase
MSGELERQANLETILRPGQIVADSYRIERLLAEGGMAAVWAGVNERTGKRVALKVILRSFAANQEAAELFRREALAASKINHPNVVSIFDVVDHEGMTCIVMELLEGETLSRYLTRNGPLSLDETVALLLPAMRGVAAANAMGVVHRDLKPGNIFLCSEADGRLVTTKVLDFGISVIMEPVGERSAETNLVAKFGTPAYMAPEAIECSPTIDGRTDVYGFGVLFFETLTGTLPFLGEPGPDLFTRILTDPPPKVTTYRPDLRPEVADIINCALAKQADNRFPDVNHLVRAVEDQLLPPPVARKLSPISGISLFNLREPSPRAAIPPALAAKENEPSARVHRSETVAIYSMAGEALHAPGRAAGAPGAKPSTVVTANWARRRLVFLLDSWRRLNRRAAIGAALAVFLMPVAWLAISTSFNSRGLAKAQLSIPAELPSQRPLVTPLPSPNSPAQPPAPMAGSVSEVVGPSEDTQANRQPAPPPSRATVLSARAPSVATHPLMRTAAPLPAKRATRNEAVTFRPRRAASPDPHSTLRAGKLSPSDF